MMRPVRLAALTPALALLAACAGPTPYAPASALDRPGYVTTPVEAGRLRVGFRGKAATVRETVERHLLFRATEAMVAAGATGSGYRTATSKRSSVRA